MIHLLTAFQCTGVQMDDLRHLVGYGQLVLFVWLLGNGNVEEWYKSLAHDSSKSVRVPGAPGNHTLVGRDNGSYKYFLSIIICWHPPHFHIGSAEHQMIHMLMLCSSVSYQLTPTVCVSISITLGNNRLPILMLSREGVGRSRDVMLCRLDQWRRNGSGVNGGVGIMVGSTDLGFSQILNSED